MFDRALRGLLERPLSTAASAIDRPAITPNGVTGVGLVLGLGSAVASGLAWWWVALVLWLLSRIADGLDGPLARRRRANNPADADAGAGGFFDITADFVVYGATVVGVAIGAAHASGAPWWPFLLVLLAYYINGTAFLAFSSIAEKSGRTIDDGRSLSFLGGLAEGTETIVVHCLWLVFATIAWQIALVWAAVVAISSAQRMIAGYRALR